MSPIRCRRPPVEASPTFALFALESGVMLGLWAKHTAQPKVLAASGANEIGFSLESDQALDATHELWAAKGLPIIQEPCRMDFGYTFVALDPDGHRLRAFAPGAAAS